MKLAFSTVGNAFFTQRYGYTRIRGWAWFAFWTLAIPTIIAAIIFGIVRSSGAASCRTFASQSHYASHYKIQHFLDAGTCYVQLPSGHALPEKMVVAYLKANK
jgi:hypothetical protein